MFSSFLICLIQLTNNSLPLFDFPLFRSSFAEKPPEIIKLKISLADAKLADTCDF